MTTTTTAPYSTILLCSGGCDSLVLLSTLVAQGHSRQSLLCIGFDYGQKHVKELAYAARQCEQHGVAFEVHGLSPIPNSALTDGRSESPIVPFRNALFVLRAASIAADVGADRILVGFNADDAATFYDCGVDFLTAINKEIRRSGYNIRIEAPLLTRRKSDIIKIAADRDIRYWSCYQGGDAPCGKCLACSLETCSTT